MLEVSKRVHCADAPPALPNGSVNPLKVLEGAPPRRAQGPATAADHGPRRGQPPVGLNPMPSSDDVKQPGAVVHVVGAERIATGVRLPCFLPGCQPRFMAKPFVYRGLPLAAVSVLWRCERAVAWTSRRDPPASKYAWEPDKGLQSVRGVTRNDHTLDRNVDWAPNKELLANHGTGGSNGSIAGCGSMRRDLCYITGRLNGEMAAIRCRERHARGRRLRLAGIPI